MLPTLSLPWTATPYLPEGQEYDSRVAQILVNEHPTIRQAINLRLASNWITHHSILDYLRFLNLQHPPAQPFGVDYTSFPPRGFHTQQTCSWRYMPLILQAANQRWPIIFIRTFCSLCSFVHSLTSLFHLSADDQNTIISTASPYFFWIVHDPCGKPKPKSKIFLKYQV